MILLMCLILCFSNRGKNKFESITAGPNYRYQYLIIMSKEIIVFRKHWSILRALLNHMQFMHDRIDFVNSDI